MNYTILVIGAFSIAMSLAWYTEGRKLFSPPVDDEAIVVGTTIVTEGVHADMGSRDSNIHDKDASQIEAQSAHC